jgi:hypothetical protein
MINHRKKTTGSMFPGPVTLARVQYKSYEIISRQEKDSSNERFGQLPETDPQLDGHTRDAASLTIGAVASGCFVPIRRIIAAVIVVAFLRTSTVVIIIIIIVIILLLYPRSALRSQRFTPRSRATLTDLMSEEAKGAPDGCTRRLPLPLPPPISFSSSSRLSSSLSFVGSASRITRSLIRGECTWRQGVSSSGGGGTSFGICLVVGLSRSSSGNPTLVRQ